ncbi:MAG: ABC transporter ATP-binding protein [Chloroflexi bacterium]|nr:ABC transporter ATP-binding protein [Chloroflexota bacterium]
MRELLVDIKALSLEMVTLDGVARVLNGVNLTIHRGDLVGLVGETGCGKSVTAMSIPQLVPQPPARYSGGEVRFLGENVLEKSEEELRRLRSRHIGVVFQDPMTGLNPVFSVEQQMVDALLSKQDLLAATAWGRRWLPSSRMQRRHAQERAIALLRRVGIPEPEKRIHAYPHEFSGGMRQRVLIAMAIAGRPDLLIADEPTTALDVSVQAQILRLIAELVREIDLTVLLITHNIGLVAQLCNRIAVMYAGHVVESGPVRSILREPQHPYTRGLLQAIVTEKTRRGTLQGVPGSVPSLYEPPPGCRFAPRCREARPQCTAALPRSIQTAPDHQVACVLYEE